MLIFLRKELEEKGFVVTDVNVNQQVIRLYVWNDRTNEIVCSVESMNRLDYKIKTYKVDNITTEKVIELETSTYEQLINVMSEVLPILKDKGDSNG